MSKEHSSVSGQLGECELQFTTIEAIGETVSSLRASFANGTMRDIAFRKQLLRDFLRGLRESKKELLDAVYFDLHKPRAETSYAEYDAVEYELGQFLDNLDKWAKPARNTLAMLQPAFLLSKSETRKEPLGTVVIIGPWNYPLRLILLPAVGALAAGNTVVVKPSEMAPHTALAIGNLVSKYLDPSVIRVVQGGVKETTALLSEKFDHYFYTGSGPVGKIVAHAAAEHLSGITLELGGKSPTIVHADVADLVPTALRIMWSKLTNAGQTCVATDYLLVHRSVKDKLVPLLVDAVAGLYGKSPQKSPDYGRIINARHWNRLMDALDATEGTVIDVVEDQPDENDLYFPPTIVDGVRPDDSLMKDELFGPILPIITYDTLDEAIALVNSRDQPLTMYVFSKRDTADVVLSRTRSGGATVNDTMFTSASLSTSFGGVGPSGVGSYQGKQSFDTFSNHRHVLTRPLWFPSAGVDTVRGPPFTGSDNSWKASTLNSMVYPKLWSLSDSVLGKLLTLIPFWRALAIIPCFLWALIRAKPVVRRRDD
ncbi:hypothetical protein H4R26_002986 [Coemansia thaxteri]|uniref:Aldehyde dehydrogenase n=1 Tax=Coemansia thaxteri TaxID=2663907 RepID=A0A9W8EF39_9FUNG|nr:hypothetical protein H4R26_002986 [Coemansia thaxteri]KAJ2480347.1 hypothetical protein EV174_003753 [Coemansia sp. RSA 2320]